MKRLAVLLMVVGTAMLVSAVAATSVGAQAGPPGNNGTVKVDGVDFDSHPDNEPHVGCVFEVDWYGFDAGGIVSQVTFETQPPTGTRLLLTDAVTLDDDDNSGGGSEAGLDGSRTYTLAFTAADFFQPNQGYHVKLTVNTPGSIGADVKHKVFWVEGCAAPTTPPPTSPPPTSPPPTTPPPTTPPATTPPATTPPGTTTQPPATVPPTTPPATTPPASVSPTTSTAPPVKINKPNKPHKPDKIGPTAFTGPEMAVPIGAAALALLTTGTGLLWLGNRRKDRTPPRPDL